MALTGRKNVAMSKLMVACNSQRRCIFLTYGQILCKPLRKGVDIGHSIPVTSIPALCEVAEARV